ncbi:MAG: hypothetical protein ACI4K7_04960, partial [Oscillospiraceae bacterium]
MNVSLNSFGISDLDSFINIHGSALEGKRQVFFVRGIGCTEQLCEKIKALDAKLLSDGRYAYRRINGFPPFRDSRAAEQYIGMYADIAADSEKAVLNGISDPQINLDFRAACRRVCGEVGKARKNFSPTMEKNLGAVLAYWSDMYLTDFLKSSGSFRKLICSGRIGCNEYAFCYLAALMGIDVCILLPGGDISVDKELLNLSSAFVIGPPQDIALPDMSAAPVKTAPEPVKKVDLSRPPRKKVSATPAANIASPAGRAVS